MSVRASVWAQGMPLAGQWALCTSTFDVMRAHGRRAAAAHKLRRRDVFKLVVRHITGGFTAPGGGKQRETRLWELDGPVPRLKYTRGHQVREGRAGVVTRMRRRRR